jgi:hypothetical protein
MGEMSLLCCIYLRWSEGAFFAIDIEDNRCASISSSEVFRMCSGLPGLSAIIVHCSSAFPLIILRVTYLSPPFISFGLDIYLIIKWNNVSGNATGDRD